MNNWTLIKGAIDEATAYTVDNYPYGSLRTQCRWWVETKAKHGQRVAKQTLNPKTGRWNKPHYGTYSAMVVLYIDRENGHCENHGIGTYSLFDAARYIGTGLSLQHDGPQAERFQAICRMIRRISSRFAGESHVATFDLALNAARAEEMTAESLAAIVSTEARTLYTGGEAEAILSMVEAERHCGGRIPTGETIIHEELAAV